jgi:hypothetical protein
MGQHSSHRGGRPARGAGRAIAAGWVNFRVLWCRERGDALWIPSVLRRGRYEKDQGSESQRLRL